MIHRCVKTLRAGAIIKIPLVLTLIFGGAAYADDTFTESPHTFTEESIEYTVDLRIGDSGKTMEDHMEFLTNPAARISTGWKCLEEKTKAGEKISLRLAQGGGFTAHFTK
jgi:hypothetical protein